MTTQDFILLVLAFMVWSMLVYWFGWMVGRGAGYMEGFYEHKKESSD